jgi:hypothetical protein
MDSGAAMPDMNVRGVDELWLRRVKLTALEQGMTLKEFVIQALTAATSKDESTRSESAASVIGNEGSLRG